MKRIKIFLASSIEDLREDRLMVGDFFRQLNEIYLDSDIHFSLIKCEDYDNAIAAGGKQQEYDREIRESELVFFLFFRKVGDYTRHEFQVALENFNACRKPRIVTYFKYVTCIEDVEQEVQGFMQMLDRDVKHYYNTYGHIDTLKLGILMQIKLLKLDSSLIRLENGSVVLNGQKIADAKNVPMLQGHELLQELTQKHRQMKAALDRCRKEYLENPSPEKETAFLDAGVMLNQVSRQLTALEQETMELMTTVAEMTAAGKVLTHRQKEALKYFNQGNYAAVHAVLEDEERENELERAQLRAEAAKNEIRGYVEEELLLIRMEIAQVLTEARVQRILTGFQKVTTLVEAYDLEKKPLYTYAWFLFRQKRYEEAISVAEKLRWYYSSHTVSVKKKDEATLHILLGGLYKDTKRYKDATAAYDKAFGLYLELAKWEPYAYQLEMANCCNCLGVLYFETGQLEASETFLKKALEMYTVLSAHDPDAYAPDLASGHMNFGSLCGNTRRWKEAESAYDKAQEIYIRLAEQNPTGYEGDLALSYNNLGGVYASTGRMEEAEEFFLKALEIRTRLTAKNPDAHEADLAMSCNNIATMYRSIGRFKEAETYQDRSVEIYTHLAVKNPDVYETNLAEALWGMASICWWRQGERMEKYIQTLRTALPLYERLAVKHPGRFQRDAKLIAERLDDVLD